MNTSTLTTEQALARRLRLFGLAVTTYLLLYGAAMWLLLKMTGADAGLVVMVVCALPMLVGAAAAMSSTADDRQYTVRLVAAAGMLPILLLFWASSAVADRAGVTSFTVWPLATWQWVVPAAVLHAVAFVTMILLAGSLLTYMAPVSGALQLAGDDLLRRLNALPWASAVHGNVVQVLLPTADPARVHRLRLRLDHASGLVHVQETLTAAGARPKDAAEADMRAIGEAAFDPARPEASSIFQRARQTTMVSSERLARTPWPADDSAWAGYDAEGLVTLACAVVTRSGWGWQPALFGR